MVPSAHQLTFKTKSLAVVLWKCDSTYKPRGGNEGNIVDTAPRFGYYKQNVRYGTLILVPLRF